MKILVNIGALFRKDIGDELFDQLRQICPNGVRASTTHSFYVTLAEPDPRIEAILSLLRPHGLATKFTLRYDRVYEPRDFVGAEYFELLGSNETHIFDQGRDESGRAKLLAGYLNEVLDFAITMPSWWFLPDRTRSLLGSVEMRGVRILPTVLIPGLSALSDTPSVPWETHGPPWWELDSDRVMPPLSDTMCFADADGQPLSKRDFSNGFHRVDGYFRHAELHYRADDLKKIEPFDVARTLEPFSNFKYVDRTQCPIVVSRRFYDFCVSRKLKIDFAPVRIDPA